MFSKCILFLFCMLKYSHSYVLIQISKDKNNTSNIDALIHRVIPAVEIDKIAEDLSRKRSNIRKQMKPKPVFRSRDEISERKMDIPDPQRAIHAVRELFSSNIPGPKILDKKFRPYLPHIPTPIPDQ
ncbi:hypothetical protein ACJJTC_006767 [Scirpophaga incertulas]